MSRGPKVASPSTSLGSTLTWLPPPDSHKTPVTADTLIQLTFSIPMKRNHAFRRLNSGCPEWVSSPGAKPSGSPPKLRPLVTPWSGKGTERKWRCHGSGFVNWWAELNEDRRNAGLLKTLQATANVLIGPTSETQPMVNILTGWAIELTPLWHLIFPEQEKATARTLVSISWPKTSSWLSRSLQKMSFSPNLQKSSVSFRIMFQELSSVGLISF